MKPPRKPASNLLFKPTTYSRNHDKNPSLISQFSTPESHKLQSPPIIHLFSSKILPCSSLIPHNSHNLHSPYQPKPTSKITYCGCISPKHGSLCAKFLDSIGKTKPIFKPFHIDQMAPRFTQRRIFSSSKSDPIASDPVNVVSTVNSPLEGSSPLDAGSSIRKPISLWPGMYHSPVTNALWEARSSIFERLSDVPENAPRQSELVTKTPSKSRTSVLYKFSDDYILREQYRNPWNEIRLGKLLEDLDALAGTISFKHCSSEDSSTRPLILVTASVDKMVLRKPIPVDTDLTIVGAVTWVGRSSMEIQLEVMQSSKAETSDPSEAVALTANFTFVARDSKTGKSAIINQISPETEKEKLLWNEAEERNKLRKKKKGEQKKEINDEEVKRLNELLSEGRVFCDMPALADRDSILIKDTCLQNSLMCQPQQRNIHGRIFGGFLMRRAFELAFATAYSFAGSAPCFVEVDHVDFLKPVDVGNFLRFNSCVLYTELENPAQPMINVEVVAHVMRPELRSSEVSNKFYFTFTVHSDALKNGLKIRNVVPATEEEARRVIERMDAERS
ncbi:acyl-coenzyme A thioesterase 9, mitochondrial isoform X1 [Sesamum indicum]|uniref:Acyl-coenzyme A thioesterase 9, mitochondrial isoform X1 n=1 Tax=Sesamum indicum TaxID=4182 RepID=A0A6I9TNW5_SESIN|nr:acyl-coenzyme A thioesterase 9, mitochondrial isoform X1 [Sesamum indicum]